VRERIVPMDNVGDRKARIEKIQAGLRELTQSEWPEIKTEILVSPFGEGIRISLVRAVNRGVYPISTACVHSLKAPIKDIVHGLWGVLKTRGQDEVKHIKRELRAVVRK
jgi:hypothetical protein